MAASQAVSSIARINPAHLRPGKQARMLAILDSVSPAKYEALSTALERRFGLVYHSVPSHPLAIKAIIRGPVFTFSEGVSCATRTFMMFHTLGHYYYISRAHQIGVDRYRYLYDTFENASLHIYELVEAGASLSSNVTLEKLRRDRTEFEVRANDFACDLLDVLGYPELKPLIREFQPADINYILDVTAAGKSAIVPTDFDYLDRYVCNDQLIVEEENTDNVYGRGVLQSQAIDWALLEQLRLEIHFF